MPIWKVNTPRRYHASNMGRPVKHEPNAVYVAIFRMLGEGFSIQEISDRMCKAHSSIEKRIHWIQAKRWASYDGKLLTPAERVVMIEREREQIGGAA
jgi:DNA-binding NarL/FixJ family response regulator